MSSTALPLFILPMPPQWYQPQTVPTPFKVWGGDGSHRLNISRFLSISSRSFSLGPLASSGWPCSRWSFKVVFSFSNEASIILWIFLRMSVHLWALNELKSRFCIFRHYLGVIPNVLPRQLGRSDHFCGSSIFPVNLRLQSFPQYPAPSEKIGTYHPSAKNSPP